MDTRGKRGSLDDICVHIARFRYDKFPALSPCPLSSSGDFTDMPLPPTLPACPKPDFRVHPRPPLPEPGSGCSVGSDLPLKPARWGARPRIPRPRNAFILFRCDFVHHRKLNPQEAAVTNVSRLAAELWNRMTPQEKEPWLSMAVKEKERHSALYPDYRYTPGNFKVKRATTFEGPRSPPPPPVPLTDQHWDLARSLAPRFGEQGMHNDGSAVMSRREPAAIRWHPYRQTLPQRRSSSCPPIGATLLTDPAELQTWAPPLVSYDDLRYHPGRTALHQPAAFQNVFHPVVPDCHLPQPQPNDLWFGMPAPYPLAAAPHQSESCGPLHVPATDGTSLDALGCMQFLSLYPTFIDPFEFPPCSSGISDEPHTFPPSISPLADSDNTGLGSLLQRPDGSP